MAISQPSVAETIERFIRAEFQVADGDPTFARDTHLFEGGFVDSLGFTQLVAFLEAAFHIEIDDEHLMDESFTTINGISTVISSCLARSTAESAPAGAWGPAPGS